jgi:hypothetical protein
MPHNRPFGFLLRPLLDEDERTVILLAMAQVAYEEWAGRSGIKADWDSLPLRDKNAWGWAVRRAVRTMLQLMGDIIDVKDEGD